VPARRDDLPRTTRKKVGRVDVATAGGFGGARAFRHIPSLPVTHVVCLPFERPLTASIGGDQGAHVK
jgi:hypothetical protein